MNKKGIMIRCPSERCGVWTIVLTEEPLMSFLDGQGRNVVVYRGMCGGCKRMWEVRQTEPIEIK